ncbi:MAG: 30S ribosome-binding factor RbfA [Synergistaceae bacterium]|jgi:ribosome-binding factor A|nr:30S ribosome-binding factor RbfA [Synergistaceae bacterium]
MERINKQLQREISLLLEQRVKNDIAKNAIIMGVDCSRDLESARVHFTTLNVAARESVLAELRNIKGALRTMLGQTMKLRQVPALDFVIDRSLDYGERIDGILHSLGLDSAPGGNGRQEDSGEDDGNKNNEEDEENGDN